MHKYLADNDQTKYSVLTLDEDHERAAHEYLTFCLLKDLLRWYFNKKCANYALSTTKTSNNDVKLIVTSTALDAEKFSKCFLDVCSRAIG